MKTKSKALILTFCAVLLVAASVLGTMAYLTSEDTVKNTFTVGSVEITLDEKDVDSDDNTSDNVDIDGETRDKANGYKLLPGKEYVKDPVIRVDSASESCYLFVTVVNEIEAIEAEKTVAQQMAEKGWVAVAGEENVFVYADGNGDPLVVAAGSDISVFGNFTIKGDVEDLSPYAEKTITVTAYAVQADGFEEKTAEAIWEEVF